jgi:hypothetical protein
MDLNFIIYISETKYNYEQKAIAFFITLSKEENAINEWVIAGIASGVYRSYIH